jgi:hypothetical protein
MQIEFLGRYQALGVALILDFTGFCSARAAKAKAPNVQSLKLNESSKNAEKQPQILRLRLARNHPCDENLSPGTPDARQTSLRMTAFLMRTLETGP